ncbi:hypothetical protein HZC32_02425, partial [Candidatus Woesearchaeota archaeon]|nr:hypothetical protein [Candidatus Woesearchaeota archaeon]
KRETFFLSVGVDAEVIQLSKERTLSGFFDYVKGSWKAVWRARADYDFNLTMDGKELRWENCVTVTLGKVPYYGYNFRSIVHSHPDDGKVYGEGVVNKHSPLLNKWLRLWCLVLTSLGLEYPPLFPLCGKQIIIRSEVPFPIQAGGDFLGYSQYLKVRVKRKQKVLVI